jgi:hypothetical protein
MTIPEALNLSYIESQYAQYKADAQSVSREWRLFFQGFDIGLQQTPAGPQVAGAPADAHVAELIHRYRDLGHLLACMDPLSACPTDPPLLELSAFGLSRHDMDRTIRHPPVFLQPSGPPEGDSSTDPAKRPTAARSGSSTCTCRTRRNGAGCRSAWSRCATGLPFGRSSAAFWKS